MDIIIHRVNNIDLLNTIDKSFGVEIDIRDHNECLIVKHDPFFTNNDKNINLDFFLNHFNHKFIILNVKSERIELDVIKLLKKYNISNYAFLDSTIPMIHLLNNKYNENKNMVRYSKYEPFEFIEKMVDCVDYIWVDCFDGELLSEEMYFKLKQTGKKICYVSPELQGFYDLVKKHISYYYENNLIPDMVCTKLEFSNDWKMLCK